MNCQKQYFGYYLLIAVVINCLFLIAILAMVLWVPHNSQIELLLGWIIISINVVLICGIIPMSWCTSIFKIDPDPEPETEYTRLQFIN
jgi:heme/copper-type cytochrome/quinol oxidase subunit 2